MNNVLSKKTSLWLLALSPAVWSLHFMATYVTAAVWCARFSGREGGLEEIRTAVLVYSFLSFAIVSKEIIFSYRKHKAGDSDPPHDDDTPEDRERFLGLARFLISCLSLIAITYTTYVALVFRSCQ